jgi:hypothetical protein
VREVRVHDDHEVARRELQPVDVGRAEAELAGARLQEDVWGVGFCELVCDDLGPVWGAVVDDYEFPVEVSVAGGIGVGFLDRGKGRYLQLGEGAV